MERRMKGGYLDQQVPYTFCSVSAAPASTPAPSLHKPQPTRGPSGVQGCPPVSHPGTPAPPPRPGSLRVTRGHSSPSPQKSPGNGSLREALTVPQGKLMDPGSLPPPDSEGKETARQNATLPTSHTLRAEPGALALFPQKNCPPRDSVHPPPAPKGEITGLLRVPTLSPPPPPHLLHSIIHPLRSLPGSKSLPGDVAR